MASQTENDIEEPPRPCDRCTKHIDINDSIIKLIVHSYPTPAPDETKIICVECLNKFNRWLNKEGA